MIPSDDEMMLLNPGFNSYGTIDFSNFDNMNTHQRKEFYQHMIIMSMLKNISRGLYSQLVDLYERGEIEKSEYWVKCTLKTLIKKV